MGDIIYIRDYKGGGTMDNNATEYNNIKSPTIYDVANYFIKKGIKENVIMTPLKLQKLCYFTKGFSLANNVSLLEDEEFQAWIHGPVSYKLYKKFSAYYKDSIIREIEEKFDENIFSTEQINIMNSVFYTFANQSGAELEKITHQQAPWLQTRRELSSNQSSNRIIHNQLLKEFFEKEILLK